VGGFAGCGVLFGFEATSQVGVGGALGLSLEPVRVAENALLASFPSEVVCGREGGGEVAG